MWGAGKGPGGGVAGVGRRGCGTGAGVPPHPAGCGGAGVPPSPPVRRDDDGDGGVDQVAIDAQGVPRVPLGGLAVGSTRAVAKASRLPEYPAETTRDLDHVKLLAERFEAYLAGVRESRGIGEKLGDTDTVDLLTGVITEFEKYSWFLRATLA